MPWNEGGGGLSRGGTVRSGTRRGRVASEIWEPLGSLAPGSWSMLVSGPAVGRWAGSLDRDIRGAVRKPCEEEELAVRDFAVSSMSCMPVEPTDMKVPAKS